MFITDICNIYKVKNIQQEESSVLGESQGGYACIKEAFVLETKDNKFCKIYPYSDVRNMISDLLERGYIPYNEFYEPVGTEDKNDKNKCELLKEELEELLNCASEGEYEGVCYCREEVSQYQGKLCVLHGRTMHSNGKDIPAFRYRCELGNQTTEMIEEVGNVEEFKKDISHFLEGFPIVQLILAYLLSGPIRQILDFLGKVVGEFGLVLSITGASASGKTTVTTTFQKLLFGKGGIVTNNITSIGLYNRLNNSGICPLIRDDASTDTYNGVSHLKQKVEDIYNIASGSCRITASSKTEVPLYAPFLESREENWGLSEIVKTIRQVEGYKYRILEVNCKQGDLTKDALSAEKLSELNGKYKGMAIHFVDYLVDNFTTQDISTLYKTFKEKMRGILKEYELEPRYANRTAVILVSAYICEKVYGIKMDIEKIEMVMIDAIKSLESRLVASPDTWELQKLYNFFTEKNNGVYLNDEYIADSGKNYNHKLHYVAFLERKQEEFYIPAEIIGFVMNDDCLQAPRFWGYDKTCPKIDIGKLSGDRWKVILQTWAELGILIKRAGNASFTKTAMLGGIPTTVYHFNWRKIAQQFGDTSPIDKTRFAHDSEEQMIKAQEDMMVF